VNERFLPFRIAVIETNNREPKLFGLCHGFFYVGHLEREVVHSFAVFVEVLVEEVVLVLDKWTDHLEATLLGEIELDPSKVTCMAEATTDVGSTKEINECLGDIDVVNRDRYVVEPLDDALKALMHRFDVGHGVAILRSYHWSNMDRLTVSVKYIAARIMKPAKNWKLEPVHNFDI